MSSSDNNIDGDNSDGVHGHASVGNGCGNYGGCAGGLIVTDYYQHTDDADDDENNNDPEVATTTPAGNNNTQPQPQEPHEETSAAWRFTDVGDTNHQSRDGSPHVTDEVFNASSHLAATILSILGSVLLIVDSSARGEPWKIVSFSIYGASLINLFACSTLHHGIIASPRIEHLLRMLDYLAIYPLIAGTFTPLTLVYYHDNPMGWAFFGTVWGVALIGMAATVTCFIKIPKWMSMTMYITLGWLGACMTYWLLLVLNYDGMFVFILGGLFYTVGGYIYSSEHPNPWPGKFGFHEIWHIAVILGAFTHWILMYFYILPWEEPSNR